MFSKSIVMSDSFLDMPLSTRCLYFSFGMLADDDGFVNNPRSVIRQVRASVDDFNLLLAKRFILTFDSGVIVIKHWKIHNYVPKDRYKQTKYLTEKNSLTLDENGGYTEKKRGLYTDCIQPVYKTYTQDKISKDKLNISLSIACAREDTLDKPFEEISSPSSEEESVKINLSDAERKLLEEYISPEDLEHYIEAVLKCESEGKVYTKKTHYQAIRDMAIKDGRYGKKPTGTKQTVSSNKSYDLDDFFEAALKHTFDDHLDGDPEEED